MSKKIPKRKRIEIEEEEDETEELGPTEISSIRPKKKPARNTNQNDIILQDEPAALAEDEPKISSGQRIVAPTNLDKIVKKRNAEFVTLDRHWSSLLQCPLASPNYTKPLPGEAKLVPGMRHFILWSLYPATRPVDQFISSLDPQVTTFLGSIQKSLDKDAYSLKSLKQAMQPAKLKRVANKLPPNFEAVIYKLWDNLYVLSQKKEKGSRWSELDFEKNIYSVLDSLLARKFRTSSNRKSDDPESLLRPDFQVSQVFGEGIEFMLLIGEDEDKDHTPIGHKDSYKLFELLRRLQINLINAGFTNISTFGILNGGCKFTLFEFNRAMAEKKYNVSWIRDENDITFTYCFQEFAKILKVLLALWQSLINNETRIQYLLDHPDELQTGHVTTTFISPEKPDTKAVRRSSNTMEQKRDLWNNQLPLALKNQAARLEEDQEKEWSDEEKREEDEAVEEEKDIDEEDEDEDDDEDKDEDDDDDEEETSQHSDHKKPRNRRPQQRRGQQRGGSKNRQHVIRDTFEFSALFPTGSILFGDEVMRRRLRNINFLSWQKLAKWCWADDRSVPYEVEVISNFPVHTIPQPIMWASVDDDKYHVIVFNEHFHCRISAIQKLRQNTYDFIRTLQYIHEKGYVHGDIKLENTSCDRDTDDFHLFDFDHSCKISDVSGRRFGTQGHRAPEYLRTRKYTIAAEMFSLGIWLIESFFQRNVHLILSKYRPNFAIDNDELNAFKILLEIFEEYTSFKPYEEMWINHCQSLSREYPWTEVDINETQFQHLRTMIRDLLNEDPAKRPSCQDLLTDPKYTPFLDTSNYFPLVIPKKERYRVTKHEIYTPKYVQVNNKGQRKRPVLKDVTNTFVIQQFF